MLSEAKSLHLGGLSEQSFLIEPTVALMEKPGEARPQVAPPTRQRYARDRRQRPIMVWHSALAVRPHLENDQDIGTEFSRAEIAAISQDRVGPNWARPLGSRGFRIVIGHSRPPGSGQAAFAGPGPGMIVIRWPPGRSKAARTPAAFSLSVSGTDSPSPSAAASATAWRPSGVSLSMPSAER